MIYPIFNNKTHSLFSHVFIDNLFSDDELNQKYEDALNDIKRTYEQVNEDGTISQWEWDIDIEQVKSDIQKDIDETQKAIKLLKSRKKKLEKKLVLISFSLCLKKR